MRDNTRIRAMDQANQYCDLCRVTVIDLYAMKAYRQPGDWLDRLRCPNTRDLASKYPPFFRFVGQFNADCPVCQIIWSAVRHDKEPPVRAVQLLATEPDDGDDFLEDLKDMARTPVRNALFWLGHRDYCPVSLLQVVPWHGSEECVASPEAYSYGALRELRIFTEPGKAHSKVPGVLTR
jgi:hypothetical protein